MNRAPSPEPFRMTSTKRAVAVAKDLRKILEETGWHAPLGQCQEIVARMYGYSNWRALSASLGGMSSPDDHQVDDAERNLRHEVQRTALEGFGLPRSVAEVVRDRLSPTGRQGEDILGRLPFGLPTTALYHPIRMFLIASHLKADKNDLDAAEIFDDLIQRYQAVDMLPLDRMTLDIDVLQNAEISASDIWFGRGHILDASSEAKRLAEIDISDDIYAGGQSARDCIYVHLGTNAFPSPWPGCGIEGCYIHFYDPTPEAPQLGISLAFVVSHETAVDWAGPEQEWAGEHGFAREDELIMANRQFVAQISKCPDARGRIAPIRLGDLLLDFSWPTHSKIYVAAWTPFLKGPLNAAWNAFRSVRDGHAAVRFAIMEDLPHDLLVKIARARTEDQLRKAFAEVNEEGELVIRYIGDAPDPLGAGPIPDVDFPYPAVVEPDLWAAGYLRLAGSSAHAPVRLQLARKASAVLSETGNQDHLRTKTLALIHEEEALSHLGRWPEALLVARRCLALDVQDQLGMRFRLASLLVRTGDATGAAELLVRYDAEPEAGPASEWGKALLQARFGTLEQARSAIASAMALAPMGRDRLLEEPYRNEAWYDEHVVRSVEDGGVSRVAYEIAGMHRDGWEAIPEHRALLGFTGIK